MANISNSIETKRVLPPKKATQAFVRFDIICGCAMSNHQFQEFTKDIIDLILISLRTHLQLHN